MNIHKKYNLGILATHPVQYYVPWYRALARYPEINLEVFYCHRQTPEGQARAGFSVPFDWDIPLLDGYKYRFLNNKAANPNVSTFFGCDTPEIMRIISDSSFDAFIVQGWYVKSLWQAIRACWDSRTPVLVRGDSQLLTQRSWINRLLKYSFFRWFIPRFDAYLVVGKRAEEYYLHYGADKNKMFFVPHCVDNDFFSSNQALLESQRENLRSDWGIPRDSFTFLFTGKLIPRKRLYDFLKALAIAHKHFPQTFGLVVGDGPLRSNLESFCRNANLPVAFIGFINQKEMPGVYTASDVLVLPSDGRETWGLVVNEALACGLPAIVSDKVGCAADLIIPGQTGEVFPCRDIEKLAEIFEAFVLKRRHLKEMGSKGRKIVIENYSVINAVEGTLGAIRAVANKKIKANYNTQSKSSPKKEVVECAN